MICKYCGAELNSGSRVCSKCGKESAASGGNGFWDIARGPGRETASDSKALSSIAVNKEVRELGWKQGWLIACAILCALSLLSSLLSTYGLMKSFRNIEKQNESLENEIKAQNKLFAEKQDKTDKQIEELDRRIEEINKKTEEKPESLIERASPSDEELSVGHNSPPGRYLFRFKVEGKVKAFCWEKQQENGEWERIEFDENKLNREYGLKLDENIDGGETKLVAAGLTLGSFGTYRCTAIATDGTEKECYPVKLINKDVVQPTPLPEAERIGENEAEQSEVEGAAESPTPSEEPGSKTEGQPTETENGGSNE